MPRREKPHMLSRNKNGRSYHLCVACGLLAGCKSLHRATACEATLAVSGEPFRIDAEYVKA